MQIEIKTVNLTKSKIQQMDYIRIPNNSNVEVLGWVNMDKKKCVIVKINNSYYRAEFITQISKEEKGVQFSLPDGGYEFPTVTNVKCETYSGGSLSYSPMREDSKNIELYDLLVSFKRKTEIAGQIYY